MVKSNMMIKKNDDNSCNTLAIIRDGKYNNKFIDLCPDDKNSSLVINNLMEHIDEKELRKQKKYMSMKDIMKLKRAFEYDQIDSDIEDIYDNIKDKVQHNIKTHIHISDGYIDPVPKIETNQTDRLYISGMSGSGKSTFISKYAQQYTKIYPNNKIYMFSKKEIDEVIDDAVKLQRIKIDSDILDIDFDYTELKHSLCIFDDISTFEKKIYEKLKHIRDSILEMGRHVSISMINVNHQILDYKNTRNLIMESNKYVIFPRSGQYQIKRFLKEYVGLDKETINIIFNKISSRWIQINKTYPLTIIAEHDVYII